MEKSDWNKIVQKILEVTKETFKKPLEEIGKSTKNKKPLVILATYSSIIVSPIALFVALIPILGIVLSLIVSIPAGYVVLLAYYYLKNTSNDPEDAKKHISNDIGNKNVQIKKTVRFSKGKIIKIFIILLVVYLLYANFHTYSVDPKITITSPRSGDVVKIDKDNTFHKISGTSKGLANSQFFHLFILYRRVDSNQEPSRWRCDYVFLQDHCTVYNDGSWVCQIQLDELYGKCVNGTFFVKSPTNSSNNISTNVEIVAIITKQSLMHSVFTKLETKNTYVKNKVDDLEVWHTKEGEGVGVGGVPDIVLYKVQVPVWRKWIMFLLPTGMGTFYDEHYDPDWHDESFCSSYNVLIHLPKHLADDTVTITPLIVDYPSGRCWSFHDEVTSIDYASAANNDTVSDIRPTPSPIIIYGMKRESGLSALITFERDI